MSSVEALRRQYDQLKPFERAVMQLEAIERKDEAAIDALTPPSLWDVGQTLGDKLSFGLVAFVATYESQRGHTIYWMSMAMLGAIYRNIMSGEMEDGPEAEQELDEWEGLQNEGSRRARAWLVALEELDKEKGGACMTYARIFAGGHIRSIMSRQVEEEVDFSAELAHLRELWAVSMRDSTYNQ